MDKKLRSNPSEYDLLKVSGLLRPILLDKPPLLDTASTAASLDVKFRVVKPGPEQIDAEWQKYVDAQWAKLHATRPEVKRVKRRRGTTLGSLDGRKKRPGRPGA
jgi:hypothetical protein